MVSVRNVKISVKIKALCLNIAINSLTLQNIPVKKYLNYVTFQEQFSYVVFKTSKNGTNHVNVTKIKSINEINEAIAALQKYLDITVVSHKIDNIIATHEWPQMVDLQCIVRKRVFHQTKYNPERFPGLFVKCNFGTIIIFHSGKLVIVGCKNLDEIWHLYNYVAMKLPL